MLEEKVEQIEEDMQGDDPGDYFLSLTGSH
jgi:hypothetical protein